MRRVHELGGESVAGGALDAAMHHTECSAEEGGKDYGSTLGQYWFDGSDSRSDLLVDIVLIVHGIVLDVHLLRVVLLPDVEHCKGYGRSTGQTDYGSSLGQIRYRKYRSYRLLRPFRG